MSDNPTLNIADWLSSQGFDEYIQAFIDNDVDAEVLGSLTSDDLKEMGVASIGHRRKILDAAAKLLRSEEHETEDKPDPETGDLQYKAERRNLTVMFCDLVDSTALSVNVDPEDFRDHIASYRKVLEAAVEPFAGHVAQYLGDGILVYFGYPRSAEHDAESAVAAALNIVRDVAAMEPFGRHQPQVRIGIATGVTVVGATDTKGRRIGETAVGETPNLAARLQGLAEADSIVVSSSTRKLIGDLFDCTDLGKFELKGFEQPKAAWRVDNRSGLTSRFLALRATQQTTAFVGREREMAHLRRQLAEAQSGRGQFVVIAGEGGFGKSRLARQIVEEASGNFGDQPVLQCTPYNVGIAFHPFRYFLEQATGVTLQDSAADASQKLSVVLARAGPVSPERLALAAELTRVKGIDKTPLLGLSSQERRNRTMALLFELLMAIAQESTTITFEDIQWMDPSTAELIEQFLTELEKLPLLLIATMRPQAAPEWLNQSKAEFVTLNRLKDVDIHRLIKAAAKDIEIPDGVLEVITSRSDGTPIFAEELARGYADAATHGRDLDDELARIPDSLADSMLARLDRLVVGRKLALTAAVIGHEFPAAVLIAVSGLPRAEARTGIDELLQANILQIKHSPFGEAISFPHMLMRDAAYQLLLRRDRLKLHLQIAQMLTAEFRQIAESVPHIVALHFEGAREFNNAAINWKHAAEQAVTRSAYSEAVNYTQKTIDANSKCAESLERDEHELLYRLDLVSALIASRGFSASGIGTEMKRVVALCKRTKTTDKLIPALLTQWMVLGSKGQHDASYEMAVQIGEAANGGSEVDRLFAHRAMATTLVFRGQFKDALQEYDKFFKLYDFDLHEESLGTVGPSNHAAMMMVGYCEIYTFFADFEKADHWKAKVFAAVERIGQMHNICHVILFAGCFTAALRDDNEELTRQSERLKSLSIEHNLPFWQDHASLFCGLSLIRGGNEKDGFEEARRGVEGLLASNAFNMCWYIIYAEACVRCDRHEEAAEYLKIVKPSQDQGEKWMAAEYHRINGRLMLASGKSKKNARAEFETALDIAESQAARLFIDRARDDLNSNKMRPK